MRVPIIGAYISILRNKTSDYLFHESAEKPEETGSTSGEKSGRLTVPTDANVEIPESESMTSSGVDLSGEVSLKGTMNVGSDESDRVKASGEPIANVSDVEKLEGKVRIWKIRAAISSLILFILGWILPSPSESIDLLISWF